VQRANEIYFKLCFIFSAQQVFKLLRRNQRGRIRDPSSDHLREDLRLLTGALNPGFIV